MAAKAQTATPLSRLSRIGCTLGVKNPSNGLAHNDGLHEDDEWYIPYTGPYEAPKTLDMKSVSTHRSSILSPFDASASPKENGLGEIEEKRGRRQRTRSIGPSNSSPVVNVHHKHSPTPHIPARPLHVHLNKSNSIGDTPIPTQRTPSSKLRNRLSLTSFLSFGQSSRTRSVSSGNIVQVKNSSRNSASSSNQSHSKTQSRHSGSKTHNSDPQHGFKQDDIYTYSNKLATERTNPRRVETSQALESSAVRSQGMSDTTRSIPHPYAVAFPVYQTIGPSTRSAKGKERVAFVGQNSIPSHLRPSSRTSYIRASMSTPDLRALSSRFPKGKDYWFSAETWCDALLRPRPHFIVRHIDLGPKTIAGSGRIVSPPQSPLSFPSRDIENMDADSQLKKSKSVADLQRSKFATAQTNEAAGDAWGTIESEEHRLRRLVLDDMVIPSPVPSLAT
jgi:serine/arginine repetitive matrix protein 2